MHSLVTNCSVVEACVQVRAESPMEHSAQGKRSGTLGLRVLEQSRPVRAKALNVRFGVLQDSNNLHTRSHSSRACEPSASVVAKM